jgi:hypothetical protein
MTRIGIHREKTVQKLRGGTGTIHRKVFKIDQMGWKYWFDSFVCLSPEFLFL